jgi:regulator of cell morphogenesis and NO signaling
MHMHKEEMILFPYIERYESAVDAGRTTPPVPFGTVANPIAMMEHEHNTAISALRSMRASAGGYTVRQDTADDLRALYAALQELEQDLHVHIHLENNILFPRALKLESANR